MTERGCWGFSPRIDELLRHRIYHKHTVDAMLQDRCVRITRETGPALLESPDFDSYRFAELRTRRFLLRAITDQWGMHPERDPYGCLQRMADFTAHIEDQFPSPDWPAARGFYRSPRDFAWGGTEEWVVAKGSDWCGEVARVLCGLTQVCGIPSRIVYTYSQEDGHVIVECFVDRAWVLVDPLASKVYRDPAGKPVSSVRMALASRVEQEMLTQGHEGYYVAAPFFDFVGVSEYRLCEAEQYCYDTSPCNDYYDRLLRPMWNP